MASLTPILEESVCEVCRESRRLCEELWEETIETCRECGRLSPFGVRQEDGSMQCDDCRCRVEEITESELAIECQHYTEKQAREKKQNKIAKTQKTGR